MENTNFVSVVPQTFDERVAMYMKGKKEDLARMLAESAKYTNPDGCAELLKDNNDGVSTYATTSTSDSEVLSSKARIALWKDTCNEYLETFCLKHEYEYEPNYAWVGDDPGTVANIGDLFVGMDDIRYDIDHDIPEEYFERWYWKSLEVYELTGVHYMNYQSYCNGAPDTWTDERLQRAKEAQERLERAKKEFNEEMERIKNEPNF